MQRRLELLYGWGSFAAFVMVVDAIVSLLLEVTAPGWMMAYPVAAAVSIAGVVLPGIVVFLLSITVLLTDPGLSSGTRWLWGVGILLSLFVAGALFFIVWWIGRDEPHPFFRKRG